jgi:hypothetical protein
MPSVTYRNSRRAKQLRKCAAMRAAKERKRLESCANEPVREDVVVRITIEHSKWPRTSLVIVRQTGRRRWQGIGARGLSSQGVGKLIGEMLR